MAPSQSSRPWWITITRVHTRSMSPVSCDVSSSVTRSRSDSLRSSSRITAFADTSRPIVGSSRKSMRGEWSRLATISQRMRSPSDSWRTGVSTSAPISNTAVSASIRRRCWRAVDFVDAPEQLERVARRQLIPQLRALPEHGADPKREPAPLPRRHEAQHAHLARVGMKNPGQHLERRRLARAVGSDERDTLARRDRERQAGRRP